MAFVLTLEDAFSIIEKLISLALVFQTLEMIQMRRLFSDEGIWTHYLLKQEWGVFHFLFKYRVFMVLLALRLVLGAFLFFKSPLLILVFLFFVQLLISLRFRGSFNGGSDSMTLTVLLVLLVSHFRSESGLLEKMSLWYLAIYAVGSYFFAGLAKARTKGWMSGDALLLFLTESNYSVPVLIKKTASSKGLAVFASWSVLLFELSFPVSLFSKELAPIYIALAVLFHLMNFFIFGLNRFFWAWLPAYPALYFCALSNEALFPK